MLTQKYSVWAGYAFETVCYKHINQIIESLNLENLVSSVGVWEFKPKRNDRTKGAQIDLLIDRVDWFINICEIKYYNKEFVVDKSYAQKLRNKLIAFNEVTNNKKQCLIALISVYGVKKNQYSNELIHYQIVLGDLFKA